MRGHSISFAPCAENHRFHNFANQQPTHELEHKTKYYSSKSLFRAFHILLNMRTCVPEAGIEGRNKYLHPTVSNGCNYLSLLLAHSPLILGSPFVYKGDSCTGNAVPLYTNVCRSSWTMVLVWYFSMSKYIILMQMHMYITLHTG